MLLNRFDTEDLPAVALSECKADLKVQHGKDDELIYSYILAACAYVGGRDGVTAKVLTSETWDYSVPCQNRDSTIVIPLTPVQSITSISYYDTDNALQTLTVTDFQLYGNDDWAYIEPKQNISWPSVYSRPDAITVRFVAGFNDRVPENIKRAIRLIVAHWYENRTAVVVGTSAAEIPMSASALLGISRTGWA